jgi:hypothetical protein
MKLYAIRIFREDGQELTVEARLIGDHAAVRRAEALATRDDRFEVWRGMQCVYSTSEMNALN